MFTPEDLLRRDRLLATAATPDDPEPGKFAHQWQRDERNPIMAPGPSGFDSQGCFAPFVVRRDDEYVLFYSGVGKGGVRICMATAPVDHLTEWKRYGPILELGAKDAFDEIWQIYPCVHRVGNRWHLYYTGQSRRSGSQYFSAFWGIGLATSDDLVHWKKYGTEPVVTGEGYPGFPDNKVVVGLGRILDLPQPDGRVLYRLYHTLPPSMRSEDRNVTQKKYCVAAHSYDGIRWFDKRVLFGPQPEVDYENIGVVGLTFWPSNSGYRGLYTALGTRFGSMSYVMCEAISNDSLAWKRPVGENLSLFPIKQGWEVTMTGYPCVIEEADQIRLLYNGATLGATGIGTAVAQKLE